MKKSSKKGSKKNKRLSLSNKNKQVIKDSSKKSKRCFKVYNPYHEALIYQYLGLGKKRGEIKMKNLDKKWDEFTKIIKKNHTCIKFYEGLIKEGGKMVEHKLHNY